MSESYLLKVVAFKHSTVRFQLFLLLFLLLIYNLFTFFRNI
jgi:hypothetical protein